MIGFRGIHNCWNIQQSMLNNTLKVARQLDPFCFMDGAEWDWERSDEINQARELKPCIRKGRGKVNGKSLNFYGPLVVIGHMNNYGSSLSTLLGFVVQLVKQ